MRTQTEVITNDRFETTRPKRMRPRPVLHETETKTNYCETETKKAVPRCCQDLNISLHYISLKSTNPSSVGYTIDLLYVHPCTVP